VRAAAPGEPIYLVEGEKAAEALRGLGVVALGTVTGAGATPCDESLRVCAEHPTYTWPDNDPEGVEHMRRNGSALQRLGVEARVIEWLDAPPKGDAADFVEQGGTLDALEALRAAAKPVEVGFVSATPRDGVWAERIHGAFFTAAEITEKAGESPEWVVPGFLARGSKTCLDGLPKMGGKTTLVLAMLRAKLHGELFLGKPTRPGPVVYLTEEHPTTFRAALARADLLDHPDFHILARGDVHGAPWGEVVRAAVAKCEEVGADTLVVDTFAAFAGLPGDEENSAGAVLQAAGPLDAATQANLAALILRHERKSQGEVGSSARGSNALTGAVDTVITIRRPEGNADRRVRALRAVSRLDVPDEVWVRWTGKGYELTEGGAVAVEDAKLAILAAAPGSETDALKDDDLFANAGVSRTTGQRARDALIEQAKLKRTGKGVKGDPRRLWRPPDSFRPNPIPMGRKESESSEGNGQAAQATMFDTSPRFGEREPEEERADR
jgi:hypothetical protein